MYKVKLLSSVIIKYQALGAGSIVEVNEETKDKLLARNLIEVLESVDKEAEEGDMANFVENVNDREDHEEHNEETKDTSDSDEDLESYEDIYKSYMELKLSELKEAAKDETLDTSKAKTKDDYAKLLTEWEIANR